MGLIVALGLAGCAGRRIEAGVYHSPKGYRVVLPGAEWALAEESRADLELHHRTAMAGMLVNGTCEGGGALHSLGVLMRRLLLGLADRTLVEQGEAALNGRPAAHVVLEGRLAPAGDRVRIETYVMKDERCVYDLVYIAPPASFETWRADFQRFARTFATE